MSVRIRSEATIPFTWNMTFITRVQTCGIKWEAYVPFFGFLMVFESVTTLCATSTSLKNCIGVFRYASSFLRVLASYCSAARSGPAVLGLGPWRHFVGQRLVPGNMPNYQGNAVRGVHLPAVLHFLGRLGLRPRLSDAAVTARVDEAGAAADKMRSRKSCSHQALHLMRASSMLKPWRQCEWIA